MLSATFKSLDDTEIRLRSFNRSYWRIALLCVFAFLFLALCLPGADYPLVVCLTLGACGIALWFGPLRLFSRQWYRTAYDPQMLFNIAVLHYCFKGVSLAYRGDTPEYLNDLVYKEILSHFFLVALYTCLGIVVWNWAYERALRSTTIYRRDTFSQDLQAVSYPASGPLLLSALGVISFFVLFRSIGQSPLFFLQNPHERAFIGHAWGAGSALGFFWFYGVSLLPIGSLLWLLLLSVRRRRLPLAWWIHAGCCALVLVVVSPRSALLGYLVSAAVLYHICFRRIRLRYLVAMVLIGLLYSYSVGLWRGVVGSLRGETLTESWNEVAERFDSSEWATSPLGTDLSDIRLFVRISFSYGSERSFLLGSSLTRIVTQLIPRAIWKEKPLDLGSEIGHLFRRSTTSGTPPGFFGEMFMNFHFVGVVVGSLLLSICLAKLYAFLILSKASLFRLLVYAILVPRVLLLPSGTLANNILTAAIFVGAAYGGFWFAKAVGSSYGRATKSKGVF